ncbi:TonB-dependent hemoglobin/transferrin/lactoferrin family receptor [Suttonella ornithocola]|uniref:Colicin I receptor n=1 Tax=Suttonella ornithocola TaxID=279832 RepID=A0A380MKQ2_9GAMM|nr:TonB-dependent hemoglobin/transferrin/lactoferrin family receptor [Suttonella ornithocola]SUO93220.1 Colicin I receptor precursor [Suttonella ornithocola]
MRLHPLFLALTATPLFAQNAPQPIILDPITVDAAREDSPLNKLANSIEVIDEKNRERHLEANIADTLNNIPGVSYNGTGRYGLSDITIRGITGNRVKILVDGQAISDTFSFGPFQNAGRQYMDANNLKQIEVIKGPASSLHGSDALGGVVNIVSKAPEDYLSDNKSIGGKAFIHYTGKDNGVYTGATLAAKANEQWAGLISYSHSNTKETKNHGGDASIGAARTIPNPQKNNSNSLNAKLVFTPTQAHRFTLSGDYYQLNRRTNQLGELGNYMNLYQYQQSHADDTQKRHGLSLRHDFTFNNTVIDNGYWKIYTQNQSAEQQTNIDATALQIPNNPPVHRQRISTFNSKDSGINAQFNKHLNGNIQHDIVYGFDYSHKNIDMLRRGNDTVAGQGRPTTERNAPNSTIDKLGIYAQDRIGFSHTGFSLIPGIRYDYYRLKAKPDATFRQTVGANYQVQNYDEKHISLRLGALYDLNDQHTLYANYAEGFRAPAFNETNLGFENQRGGYAYVANLNLKPETSRGIELGWRSDNGIFKHDIAAYYNRYKNFIQSESVIGVNPQTKLREFSSINLPSAEIYGIDASLGLDIGALTPNLDGLKTNLSFAYAKGKNRKTHEPLNTIAPLSGYWSINYDHPNEQWGIGSRLNFAAAKKAKDITNNNPRLTINPVGGYATWDMTAYYRPIKDLTLRAGAYNLLDKKYISWGEARVLDEHKRQINTATGRWFGASVRYDF